MEQLISCSSLGDGSRVCPAGGLDICFCRRLFGIRMHIIISTLDYIRTTVYYCKSLWLDVCEAASMCRESSGAYDLHFSVAPLFATNFWGGY